MIKRILKEVLPPMIVKLFHKKVSIEDRENTCIEFYLNNGRPHYKDGYGTYKFKYINDLLEDDKMLSNFKYGEQLQKDYGFRLDDRVVEYPLIFSNLEKEHKHILDAAHSRAICGTIFDKL
jgi:hypothetical protein